MNKKHYRKNSKRLQVVLLTIGFIAGFTLSSVSSFDYHGGIGFSDFVLWLLALLGNVVFFAASE